MSDVSCRITEGIILFMEQGGYSLQAMRDLLPMYEDDGRPVTEATLRSARERISWANFIKIMHALPELSTDAVQQQFVQTSYSQALTWVGFVSPIMRLFLSADRMLIYIQSVGEQLFSNIRSDITRLPDGRFLIVLQIPPEHEDLPAFFQITTKNLRLIPTVIDWPQAIVDAQIFPRRGEFLVSTPVTASTWHRMKMRLKVLLGFGASMHEIGQSHQTMLKLYNEAVQSAGELRLAQTELEARVLERTQALELAVQRLEREAAERRAAEDRAALLGSLLETSSQEIYILCANTLHFLTANAGALRNLGYSHEELLGLTPVGVSARRSEDVQSITKKIAAGLIADARFTSEHQRKNGEIYPIEVHLQKANWEGRTVLIAIVADITDRVRAESERHQLLAELHAAQRQQSVGALAGGVAHEFNNILTPILAHVALIAPELAKGSRGSDSVGRIEKAVERGRNIVKQILAMRNPTVGVATTVNLSDIVVEAVALFRPTLPSNITLKVQVTGDDTCIHAVTTEIHQIVLNLLTNATHALPEAGGQIKINVTKEASTVVLSVADNGCGMDEGTKSKIFDPFFTTKESGKGSGIGLSIVRDITARHGATVKVESTLATGAAFVITFPHMNAAPQDGGRAAHNAGWDHFKQQPIVHGRVLLVDDEEEIAYVLGEALRDLGFDITTAVTPEEALAHVVGMQPPFDLVVTDMSMPNMNGIELAKAIRKVSPSLRVCLLSGYAGGLGESATHAKDIHAVFDKPIEPAVLAAAMRAAIST